MALVRWDPFRDLTSLQDRMNRLFEDSLFRTRSQDTSVFSGHYPSVDIVDQEKSVVLRAELPGVKRDDIEINIENNVLTLKGEKARENGANGNKYHRSERYHGEFNRAFTLPNSIDTSKVKATHRDGVLSIDLPKAEEALPKRIAVEN